MADCEPVGRVGVCDILSRWRDKNSPKDNSTQTSVREFSEIIVQTEQTSLTSKTLKEEVKQESEQADEEEMMKLVMSEVQFDAPSVLVFLKNVIPLVEQQLDQNASSHAFDDFDVNWNDQVDSVQCLYNFSLPKILRNKTAIPLSCTDLSWNSNGKLLAASYGRINLTGWCLESGYVAICAVPSPSDIHQEKKFSQSSIPKTPAHVIEIEESYAMKVSFHPKLDNVIAIGTYDGGIRIHKLEKETDSLIASSRTEHYSHRDPITALQWLKNRIDNSYVLVSMSSDGVIIWWSAKNRLTNPIAIYRFNDIEKGVPLGASSLTFLNKYAGSSLQNKVAPTTDNSFVIGTEVGQVFKTTFSQIDRINTNKKEVLEGRTEPQNATLDFKYDTSIGYIHTVEASPFQRNLFLSSSSDGLIRIYNSFKHKDILTLQPQPERLTGGFAFDARWSPFRPLVIGVGTDTGRVLLYDLEQSVADPIVNIDAITETEILKNDPITRTNVINSSALQQGRAVLSVRFNHAARELFATCDQQGMVKIWLLNDVLTQMRRKELRKLLELFQ